MVLLLIMYACCFHWMAHVPAGVTVAEKFVAVLPAPMPLELCIFCRHVMLSVLMNAIKLLAFMLESESNLLGGVCEGCSS